MAYAHNRKEAKAGVARHTGTSGLHFGRATSTETTQAIVASCCINMCQPFDLFVCHILSHWSRYKEVRLGFSVSRGIDILST